MSTRSELLDTLKRRLKSLGLHYSDVAKTLDLSETSVKRLFARGDLSLERLESVCLMVDWNLADLVDAARRESQRIDELSMEQEAGIAADLVLLMIAVSVINGFSFQDLIEQYALSEHDVVRKLAHLDRLQLIDLLPGNRIKLKVSSDFRWRARGPIQEFFLTSVVHEFFNSHFAADEEKLLVINGLISVESNAAVQNAMDKLSATFVDQMRTDQRLSMEQKKGNTLVLALRRWRYPAFEKLRRRNE